MRLAKSFEQGVCIMAILATQKSEVPVSSRALQRHLRTSITYSQKILRKLVVAGLIKSISGNNGGFTLAKTINDISVLDVVTALEGKTDSFPNTGLFNEVFAGHDDDNVTTTADQVVHHVFATADSAWSSVLAQVSLQDIIMRVINAHTITPQIDWNSDDGNVNITNQFMARGGSIHA